MLFESALFLASTFLFEQAVAPPNSLELNVRLDSEAYDIQSSISIQIEVVNDGTTPVSFWEHFTMGIGGTLDYVVRRRNGEELGRFVIIDNLDFEEPSLPTVIRPGDTVKASIQFRPVDLVSKPGEYEIEFTYVAPDISSDHLESHHPIWTKESGPLIGSAEFEVLEGRH